MKHNNVEKYYCGKTNNINRRMKEHKNDRWKNYQLVWYIEGDYEKRIKKFGVNQFMITISTGSFINYILSPEVE